MPQYPQINFPSVLLQSASLHLLLFYFCAYISDVQFEKEDFLLMIKLISMVLSQACAIVLKPTPEEFSFHSPADGTVRIF